MLLLQGATFLFQSGGKGKEFPSINASSTKELYRAKPVEQVVLIPLPGLTSLCSKLNLNLPEHTKASAEVASPGFLALRLPDKTIQVVPSIGSC